MNKYAKAQVLECLQELADRSFQERVWVRGVGPEVSSSVEAVCQLFDDTGVGDALEAGTAGELFGDEAAAQLLSLSELLERLPGGLGDAALLEHPLWDEVVATADRAARLVAAGAADWTDDAEATQEPR